MKLYFKKCIYVLFYFLIREGLNLHISISIDINILLSYKKIFFYIELIILKTLCLIIINKLLLVYVMVDKI